MTGPVEAALLIAHIIAVIVSYGALGATGAFARTARMAPDPFTTEAVRRFFRPGHNIAGRVLYAVPVLGIGLLFCEPSGDFTRGYPWIGIAIWVTSIAIATGSLWPAEEALQHLLEEGSVPGGRAAVRTRAREIERSSGLLAGLFVVAVIVMIARF